MGVLHVALLWWGDVLWTYAIAGFGLLLFHRASNRTRVIAALVLMFVPAAVYRLPGVWLQVFERLSMPANLRLYNDQMIAAMHGFDYVTVMKEHVQFAWVWSAGSWPQYRSLLSSATSCSATWPARCDGSNAMAPSISPHSAGC